nr:hypothetical protein [uncultured Niameybacter sp.]
MDNILKSVFMFNNNHKREIKTLFLASILIIIAYILTLNNSPIQIQLAETKMVLPEITKNTPVSTTFNSPINNLNKIELIIGTYGRENNSTLQVKLINEEEEKIYDEIISAKDLKDNEAYTLNFKEQKNSKNKNYKLEIVSDADKGNGITIYYDENLDGEIINYGEDIFSGKLSINLFGNEIKNIFEYGITLERFLILLIFVYILCLIVCKFQFRLTEGEQYLMMLAPALIIIFFSIHPIITYDTAHYHTYLPILNGELDWSNWDIARGIVFPAFINIAVKIFGANAEGITSIMFCFYITYILICIKIMNQFNLSPSKNKIIYSIFTLLVIFNPLIIGAFHTLLTEFIGATIAILSCYIGWKWINKNTHNKLIDYFYMIYFIVMSVIMWQLKQPYTSTVIFPLIMVIFISLIRRLNIRIIIFSMITLVLSGFMISTSIIVWEKFIEYNGAMNEERKSSGIFSKTILWNMINFKEEELIKDLTIEEVEQDRLISVEDKQIIKEIIQSEGDNYKSSKIITVYDQNQLVSKELLLKQDEIGTTSESIKFWIKSFINYPKNIIQGYIANYLAIANILNVEVEDGVIHRAGGKIQTGHGNENDGIYYRSYYKREAGENIFYMPDELYQGVKQYTTNYSTPKIICGIFIILALTIIDSSYRVIILLLPIFFIYSLWKVIKNRKIKDDSISKLNDMLIICSFYAFFHTALHCIVVHPIDRYAFVAYTTMLPIILIILGVNRNKYMEWGKK